MNLNVDGSSPWFHVHFTLPNQCNKRSEVKYDSQRKRIKDLIQNKDAFLAPTSQRNTNRCANKPSTINKKSKEDSKRRIDNEQAGNFDLRTTWFSQNGYRKSADIHKKANSIENKIFIDTKAANTTKQDRKSILPPLEGNKTGVIVCCPGQQDNTTEAKMDHDEVKEPHQRIITREIRPENTLSIADCYDLCNWKPQSSLCKEARPLVSILKQNTRKEYKERPVRPQGHSSLPSDSSESSGNETENETNKKKVRFAKGTKFSPSSTYRKYRNKRNILDNKFDHEKESSSDENNLEDMIELSFREFIQRKRIERAKVMAETSKDSSMLCYLKGENKLPKVNTPRKQQKQRPRGKRIGDDDKEDRRTKVDTLLPTVVN